jgi:hypothetical protein
MTLSVVVNDLMARYIERGEYDWMTANYGMQDTYLNFFERTPCILGRRTENPAHRKMGVRSRRSEHHRQAGNGAFDHYHCDRFCAWLHSQSGSIINHRDRHRIRARNATITPPHPALRPSPSRPHDELYPILDPYGVATRPHTLTPTHTATHRRTPSPTLTLTASDTRHHCNSTATVTHPPSPRLSRALRRFRNNLTNANVRVRPNVTRTVGSYSAGDLRCVCSNRDSRTRSRFAIRADIDGAPRSQAVALRSRC